MMAAPAKLAVITVVIVALLLDVTSGATTFRRVRSVDTDNATARSKENTTCHKSTPCGWAVYNRYSREIEYFMRNKCDCNDGHKCLRADDDISVTAYVYRCKDADNPKKKPTAPQS